MQDTHVLESRSKAVDLKIQNWHFSLDNRSKPFGLKIAEFRNVTKRLTRVIKYWLRFSLCSRRYFILQDTMTCCQGSCITWLDLELHMKAFLQWRNLTSLRLQNIAMSKTEFPFEKLASVWLRVNFFYVPSRLLLSSVVFVVAPLSVRREVLEWIQEWKSNFFHNQIG